MGFVGNITVVCVVLKRPHMRTVTNRFIMNLAVADLFFVLFCVPRTLVGNIFKRNRYFPLFKLFAEYMRHFQPPHE